MNESYINPYESCMNDTYIVNDPNNCFLECLIQSESFVVLRLLSSFILVFTLFKPLHHCDLTRILYNVPLVKVSLWLKLYVTQK